MFIFRTISQPRTWLSADIPAAWRGLFIYYIFPNFRDCALWERDLKNNKHNSGHWARKYARIFVIGHYPFIEACSPPRAALSKICSLLGIGKLYVKGQISLHIFAPNGGYYNVFAPIGWVFSSYINNSLHLARKYARIFVRGHYLFREANSFPRAKLKENCELRGTDNVQGQISAHIFKVKWRLLSLLSFKYFSQHRREISQSVICQSRQSLSIGFQRLSTFVLRLSNRLSFS